MEFNGRHFVSAILTSRFRGEVFHRVGGGSVLLFTRSSNLKTWVRGQGKIKWSMGVEGCKGPNDGIGIEERE